MITIFWQVIVVALMSASPRYWRRSKGHQPTRWGISRQTISRNAHKLLEEIGEDVRLEAADGSKPFIWRIANIGKVVQKCVDANDGFGKLLARRVATRGAHWHLLLYGDEVVPGSFLRPETNRKFMGYYISFAEFGVDLLCQDEAWFHFAAVS